MTELKMLLVLCSSERATAVRRLVDAHRVHGFTEIPNLYGSGSTGRHLGTRAFPGAASLIFTAVPAEQAAELIAALKELAMQCAPGEGLRTFVLDAVEAI